MELLKAGKPFFKGNLHLHTQNSDGALSPEDAEKRYQGLGYDFIAVTDHWKRTVETHYCKNMLVIPGIEVDFFLVNQVIHIVGIGVDEGMGQLDRTRLGPQSAVNRRPSWLIPPGR
jgi:predicted metal-dependent phosphoesterase TrpH